MHNDAHTVGSDTENRGEIVSRSHRAAHPGIEGVAARRRIVFTDRRSRLYRNAGDALNLGVELHDVRSPSKGGRARGGVEAPNRSPDPATIGNAVHGSLQSLRCQSMDG